MPTITSKRTSRTTREVTVHHTSYTDVFAVPEHFTLLSDPLKSRQNADGKIHLTYYDRDNLLSYVWDGHADHIEVSHGGYAEPVFGIIPIDPDIVEEVTTTNYDDNDGSIVRDVPAIFARHVYPEEFADPYAAAAVCPECGDEAGIVQETSQATNEILGFGLGTIHVIHEAYLGDGNFVFKCPAGHEYPVPAGIEVLW